MMELGEQGEQGEQGWMAGGLELMGAPRWFTWFGFSDSFDSSQLWYHVGISIQFDHDFH